MNTTRSHVARLQILLLILTQLLFSFPTSVQAQNIVDISVGKPSVWTLAQAHYLLAQMHKTDRSWQINPLSNLDPNGINRQRIEILQTLLGITAEFDATAGFKNRILERRYDTILDRQERVRTQLDHLNNELIQGNRELYYINVDLNKLKSATTPDQDAIKLKNDELNAKTVERDSINTRISALNTELTGLNQDTINANIPNPAVPFANPTSQPTPAPYAPELGRITPELLNKIYADTQNRSSQLQASIQLDNYIQMQYEVISKQLTLLRDEVGPDQRVIFLELPASIYSVPKRSDGYVAQVRWQVTDYSKCSRTAPQTCPAGELPPIPSLTSISAKPITSNTSKYAALTNVQERNTLMLAEKLNLVATPTPTPTPTQDADKCWENTRLRDLVRTVDIIPRQSALNVNSTHDTTNGLALSARFLALFGFGGKVDYQKQREVYDQFVYQDIFASGFGKGTANFGWTFGPLPGTKNLAPGLRTTYAVMVIPAEAKRIKMTGSGFAISKGEAQPDATKKSGNEETFEIEIPDDAVNGVQLCAADYASVHSGERLSLVLSGEYISPQVGILVNGVPLERKVAVSPIDLPSPTPTPNSNGSGVNGEYEYVNSRRLIASFAMGANYEGTPVVALVTPQETTIINKDTRISVNGNRWQQDSLEIHGLLEPMFLSPLAISRVQLDRTADCDNLVRAVVSGRGFRPNATFSINGNAVPNVAVVCNGEFVHRVVQKSTHEYDLLVDDPGTPSWDITLRQNTSQGQEEISFPLTRPFAPRVSCDILQYVPGRPARANVRLNSSEFQTINEVSLISNGRISAPMVCSGGAVTAPNQPPVSDPGPTGRRRGRGRPRSASGGEAEPPGVCRWISAGEVLLTLNLPAGGNEPSFLLLVKGDKAESALLNILPPAPPTITSIVNDATKKAEGAPEGGYQVTIRGENLEQIERVFFGGKPATLLQVAAGVLIVTVPAGEEGAVRVLLETNTPYQGKFLSNVQDFADPKEKKAIFNYVKPK